MSDFQALTEQMQFWQLSKLWKRNKPTEVWRAAAKLVRTLWNIVSSDWLVILISTAFIGVVLLPNWSLRSLSSCKSRRLNQLLRYYFNSLCMQILFFSIQLFDFWEDINTYKDHFFTVFFVVSVQPPTVCLDNWNLGIQVDQLKRFSSFVSRRPVLFNTSQTPPVRLCLFISIFCLKWTYTPKNKQWLN